MEPVTGAANPVQTLIGWRNVCCVFPVQVDLDIAWTTKVGTGNEYMAKVVVVN